MVSDSFSDKRVERPLRMSPRTTAVLVVDMVNEFLEEGGVMVLPGGSRLYEPINRLTAAARQQLASVVWVCDEHPLREDKEFEKRVPHCMAGTWGAEVVDALKREPSDLRVAKRRYSAFFGTDLDLKLRERQIQHLIVTGIVTNICVRSTVHDAFFLGYDVVVPEECVAATGEREQASSLYDIETHFGAVRPLGAVLELLGLGSDPGSNRRLAGANEDQR